MATLSSELVVRLIDRVTGPARGIANAVAGIPEAVGRANVRANFGDRLAAGIDRNNRALDKARGGLFDAAASYYLLRGAIMAPVNAAADFESAMADVAKVVDFESPEAFEQFQADLKAMSREIPVALQGLASIAASAGEAGFQGDELLKVAEAAAKIGVAFGIAPEAAGEALPQLMNSMGLTLDEAISLADSINHLSNNMASGAPKILNYQTGVGAAGQLAGFTAEQTAAFGSAMIAAGADADVAATSFRNMAQRLGRGEAATKSQASAMKRLGLDAVQVSKDMQEDAVGTTLDVLDRLGQMPADLQVSLTEQLFGNEARALAPLIGNTDLLLEALGYVADESTYAGSAFAEFEVRAKTFGSAMQRAKNAISTVAISIGSALLPPISDLAERLIPVAERLATFAESNETLVASVVGAMASVVAFKAAAAGLRFVGLLGRGGLLSMLSIGFHTVGRAGHAAAGGARSAMAINLLAAAIEGRDVGKIESVGTALGGIVRSIPGVSRALCAVSLASGFLATLTAPAWGAVVFGAAAVAGAGLLIYRHWESVKAIVRGVAAALTDRLGPAFEFVGPLFDRIEGQVDRARQAIAGFWDGLTERFSGLGSLLGQVDISDEDAAGLEAKAKGVAGRIIDALTIGPSLLTVWRHGWIPLGTWLSERAGVAVSALSGITEALSSVGTDAMTGLFDGLKAKWLEVVEWFRGLAAKAKAAVGNLNPFAGGDDPEPSPGSNGRAQRRGGRAFGGFVAAGETVEVGERGREVITPDRDGWVTTNAELVRGLRERAEAARALADVSIGPRRTRAGGDRTVHLGGVTIHAAPGQSPREIADEVIRRLTDEIGGALEGAHAD